MQLQQLMPELFREGNLDPDALKKFFWNGYETAERYGLGRAGKAQAVNVIKQRTSLTLHPEQDKSVDWDKTENLFIEGDNLDVLRILQKSYYNKIKMIYIDPPYNTGSDAFVYPDDYSMTTDQYNKLSGKVDEDGNLLKDDRRHKSNKDSGRYHSNWLSMMYPRLFLARNLLTDDWVIFVSIDDNEIHNLKLLMNEIFGEENFISQLPRSTTNKWKNDEQQIAVSHDYVIMYGSIQRLSRNSEFSSITRYKLEDSLWRYYAEAPLDAVSLPYSSSLDFTIKFNEKEFNPITYNGKKTCWRWSKDLVEFGIKNNLLIDKNGRLYSKTYLNYEIKKQTNWEYKLVEKEMWGTFRSQLLLDYKFSNNEASRNLKDLWITFDYTKPVSLINQLIKLLPSNQNDIILDFFSWSWTTAHAVMALNAEDGGNRKYIMVQYPENTEEWSEAHKAWYTSIPEIARERIRRAGKKILEEKKSSDGLFDERSTPLDTGFKSFVVGSSNFKQRRADQIDDQSLFWSLEAHLTTIKSHSTPLSMLYELILKHGVSLTEHITIDHIGDKEFFDLWNGALIVCLEQSITQSLVDGLMARKPSRIIMLDIWFQWNDALLKNTHLQCEHDKISFQTL
jgi:adenine-specific DNA-methyltransferase